jgi:hypothetical protein
VASGAKWVASGISNVGTVDINSHSVLLVIGQFSTPRLDFLASNATVVFGKPTNVSATIAGFRATDTLDLANFPATRLSFAGRTLTVDGKAGNVSHLTFAASYTTKDFHFAPDHHGGTNITFV